VFAGGSCIVFDKKLMGTMGGGNPYGCACCCALCLKLHVHPLGTTTSSRHCMPSAVATRNSLCEQSSGRGDGLAIQQH
jgi:hypothetical protein